MSTHNVEFEEAAGPFYERHLRMTNAWLAFGDAVNGVVSGRCSAYHAKLILEWSTPDCAWKAEGTHALQNVSTGLIPINSTYYINASISATLHNDSVPKFKIRKRTIGTSFGRFFGTWRSSSIYPEFDISSPAIDVERTLISHEVMRNLKELAVYEVVSLQPRTLSVQFRKMLDTPLQLEHTINDLMQLVRYASNIRT